MNFNNEEAIRRPAHSVESEQSVIGGLLLDNRAWDKVCELLTADDFYRDDHRRIFRTIAELLNSNKPADVVTVFDALQQSNETNQTGGLAYLGEIANNTPSAANIKRYAETVAGHSLRRKIISAANEITDLATSAQCPQEALEAAQTALNMIGESGGGRKGAPKPIQDVLRLSIENIERAFESGGKLSGLKTGFTDLDKRIRGLRAGDVVVVAGRPGMGKTTIGMNIIENVCLAGGSAVVFSLEMGEVQLATRTIARFGSVELGNLLDGNMSKADFDGVSTALAKTGNFRLEIDETPALSIHQIKTRAARVKRKLGSLDVVMIDYIGLIKPATSKTTNNRNDEITQISAGIKAMAKELGCPVLALSQLSRKGDDRSDKRPMMSDLRDSGSIEQDADMVILMYRDEYYYQDSQYKGLAEANVVKHRNGEPGAVTLSFEGKYSRFGDAQYGQINFAPIKKTGKGFNLD